MSDEAFARERGSIDYDLRSADEEIRRLAVERLSALPSDEALPRLVESLGDAGWRVRKAAVSRLVHCADAAAATRAVIEALADGENSGRRNSAAEALVRRGRDALPYLVEALSSDDSDVRKQVVDVIAGIGDGSVSPAVRLALRDADPNVSAAAADALGVLGGAQDELREVALDTRADPLVRISALRALARLEVEVDLGALEGMLDDPILRPSVFAVISNSSSPRASDLLGKGLGLSSRSSRDAAITGLVHMLARSDGHGSLALVQRIQAVVQAEPELVDSVIASFESAEPATRQVIMQFLGVVGDPRATVPLLEAARDQTAREVARAALGMLGDGAEAAIDRAWDDLDSELRLEACGVLAGTRGELGALRLQRLLDDPDARQRAGAAAALGRRRCATAIPALIRRIECASEQDEEEREELEAVVEALAAIGSEDAGARAAAEVVELLGARVDGSPELVRLAIARVLGRIARPADERLVAMLLKDPSALVRRVAVDAIARLLDDDDGDAEPLRLALADEAVSVRIAAARALGRLGAPSALDDLERLLGDEDPRVRSAAVRALGVRGASSESQRARALETIEAVLGQDSSVSIACAEALAELGGPDAARAASRLLEHDEPEVVLAAIACVAKHTSADLLPEILPLIAHSEWSVRAEAVQVLGERRFVGAVPAILRHLETEQDAFVREAILNALRRLGE